MADEVPPNFIRDQIAQDVKAGKNGGRVVTRFPPEPNGYLHLGHVSAIRLNFAMAHEFGGHCNLRFDDTNPVVEEEEFVEAMRRDIKWLGYDWGDNEFFASDYFEQLHDWAVHLINEGNAYVDSQSTDEIRENRGDYYRPGKDSPHRDRSVEENLDLFKRMRDGEFADGEHVLRAKIDMASPNLNLRDPLLYRIKHAHHHRTGDDWCIYPMYDFAHGQSDAIEGVTHSICTLEFEDHRPLYDWLIEHLPVKTKPQQLEWSGLDFTYTVMSKRWFREMVADGTVAGWDDPRMPTVSGMRRRGYPPQGLIKTAERVAVSKRPGSVDISLLEHTVRDELNATSARVMCVLRPLKVVIENFDEDVIWFDAPYHPDDPSFGTRRVPLTREVYVERDDFREEAPRKWFRLAPGREVRLRYAGLITCRDVIKDDAGEVTQLACTWDPASKGGKAPDGRRVRGTLHWVSAAHGVAAEVRLYDRLFLAEHPGAGEGRTYRDDLNPNSLEVLDAAVAEPSLAQAEPLHRVQFERKGYFCVDPDTTNERLVFNRTIELRDTWAKIEAKLGKA